MPHEGGINCHEDKYWGEKRQEKTTLIIRKQASGSKVPPKCTHANKLGCSPRRRSTANNDGCWIAGCYVAGAFRRFQSALGQRGLIQPGFINVKRGMSNGVLKAL